MQLNRVINGILKYIEREMFPKMNSWQQLGMGVVVGRMARDTKSIKELGIVKLLNVVDEHDNVDVEGLKTAYEMYQKILSEAPKRKSDLIRVEIYGEIDFFDEDLSKELESLLNSSYYAVSVKDKTVKKFVLDGDDEISLKNEFKNAVFESDLSPEEKQRVLALGLKALSGREIE
jgi:hypothetical protein